MTEPFVEKLKQLCMWCDNIALYECDAVIGMSAQPGPKGQIYYASLKDLKVWTCDALMCSLHRHIAGFYCGKDPGTLDRCPQCAGSEARGEPMTKEDADRIRRDRHSAIRRSRIRSVG